MKSQVSLFQTMLLEIINRKQFLNMEDLLAVTTLLHKLEQL